MKLFCIKTIAFCTGNVLAIFALSIFAPHSAIAQSADNHRDKAEIVINTEVLQQLSNFTSGEDKNQAKQPSQSGGSVKLRPPSSIQDDPNTNTNGTAGLPFKNQEKRPFLTAPAPAVPQQQISKPPQSPVQIPAQTPVQTEPQTRPPQSQPQSQSQLKTNNQRSAEKIIAPPTKAATVPDVSPPPTTHAPLRKKVLQGQAAPVNFFNIKPIEETTREERHIQPQMRDLTIPSPTNSKPVFIGVPPMEAAKKQNNTAKKAHAGLMVITSAPKPNHKPDIPSRLPPSRMLQSSAPSLVLAAPSNLTQSDKQAEPADNKTEAENTTNGVTQTSRQNKVPLPPRRPSVHKVSKAYADYLRRNAFGNATTQSNATKKAEPYNPLGGKSPTMPSVRPQQVRTEALPTPLTQGSKGAFIGKAAASKELQEDHKQKIIDAIESLAKQRGEHDAKPTNVNNAEENGAQSSRAEPKHAAVPRPPAPPPAKGKTALLDITASENSISPKPPLKPISDISATKQSTLIKEVPAQTVGTHEMDRRIAAVSIPLAAKMQDLSDNGDFTKKVRTKILPQLQVNPAYRLQIQSYASSPDGDNSNARRLSLSRALAARQVMIKEGISANRIDIRALGNDTSVQPADRLDLLIFDPNHP